MINKILHFTVLLAFALLACQRMALAEGSDYHLHINSEIMVPYNFYDNNDKVIGINIEIVKALLARTNISADINIYPWVRSYQLTLKQGNAGLMSTARTVERESQFKWVGPLASGEGYLYQLRSRTDIKINSLQEAQNYLVAVVRGDVYQDIFEKLNFQVNKNLMLFSYNAEYIKPFLAGKVDLILGSDIVLPYMLAAGGSNIDAVKAVVKIPDTQGNYLALNKNVPDDVVKKLNNALVELKQSEEYDKIINKYKRLATTYSTLGLHKK